MIREKNTLWFGLFLALCGCASQPSLPTGCPAATDCGGSVIGTWTYLGRCGAPPRPLCNGGNIDYSNYQLTLTFKSDGTYDEFASGSFTEYTPLSCLIDSAASCAGENAPPDRLCAPSGADCVCTFSGIRLTAVPNGKYTTSGNQLDFADPPRGRFSYCVANGKLEYLTLGTTVEMWAFQ